MPGLIDLHVHVYDGVSHYGIDADTYLLRRGTTTGVDVGSAGAQTFPGLRRMVIEQAQTRIYAYLHIAVEGMISRARRRAGGHPLGLGRAVRARSPRRTAT